MPAQSRFFACFAALSLCLATALGAYASHALPTVLEPRALGALQTAIAYQFYHSLGLLGVAVLVAQFPHAGLLRVPGWLLAAGVVLFSGSIYATTLGAPSALGQAAPAGGLAFIGAWLVLAIAVFRLPAHA